MSKDNKEPQEFLEHSSNPQHWHYWYTQWKETPMLADKKDMSFEEMEKYDQFLRLKAEEVAKSHFVEEKFQHNLFEWTCRYNRNGDKYYDLTVENNELALIQSGYKTVYEVLVKEHGTELYIVFEKDCSLSEALDLGEKGAQEYLAKHKENEVENTKTISNDDIQLPGDNLTEHSFDDQYPQLDFDFGEDMDL